MKSPGGRIAPLHERPLRPTGTRVSVVIRCYQQGRFLDEAIASLRAQTRPPDEIVVVDDGSTDETAEVLAAHPDLVVVRHATPRGPAETFNSGVAAATGDLVMALDGDDALSPRYLELTEQAIFAGADLAYGAVERFGAEQSFTPAKEFDVDELGVENLVHVATLFRRELFEVTGGFRSDFDDLSLEDWEFWVNAVEHGAAGRAVDGCWLRYRRHAEGSRGSIDRKMALRIHLRVHRLHPRTVTWRHLARWAARSVRRNLR